LPLPLSTGTQSLRPANMPVIYVSNNKGSTALKHSRPGHCQKMRRERRGGYASEARPIRFVGRHGYDDAIETLLTSCPSGALITIEFS
jgi:hypothetical protein